MIIDEDTFNKCKELMHPEKHSLQLILNPDDSCSKEDLVKNSRLCVLSIGDHIKNCLEMYSNQDVHNEYVADAMPRNRFDTLMKYIHFADNNHPDPNDKMWKIRKLYDMVNARCLRYVTYGSDLSIDETQAKNSK